MKVAADGHVVYKWYHRLFLEAARNYFLSDKPFTDSLHRNLANYFNGRYVKQLDSDVNVLPACPVTKWSRRSHCDTINKSKCLGKSLNTVRFISEKKV